MRNAVALLGVFLLCGCATTSSHHAEIPAGVPAEARPVWLSHKAYESDDFRLFCSVMSRETLFIVKEKIGLRRAFEDGRAKSPAPLRELTFTASRYDPGSFPGMRLEPGYAFVQTRRKGGGSGTLVKLEKGEWKLAFPSEKRITELLEPGDAPDRR